MFKDGQPPCVGHEIFHTEGLQGFIYRIRREIASASFTHEQTKGQTGEATLQTLGAATKTKLPCSLSAGTPRELPRPSMTTSRATLEIKAVLSSAAKSLLHDVRILREWIEKVHLGLSLAIYLEKRELL